MSSQIPVSFVDQFSRNVFHLSQQKGSKLRRTVRNESQNSESSFYDRIGAVTAQVKGGRHSDTPQNDTPHTRRMVTLVDYEQADLIDKEDKIRTINDPTNDYVMAHMWAHGRAMDDVILAALGGNAYGGQKGTDAVALPNSQKFACNNGAAHTNLNVKSLRSLARMFDDQEVEGKRFIACAPSQIESMLGQTEVTSSDYNSVKALVQGEVNSFMGFEFIKTTRLTTAAANTFSVSTGAYDGAGASVAGFRKCFAWAQDGALLAVGSEVKARVGERADKSYSNQVYSSMSIGATRLEEVKVIEFYAKET
jgi:hypothetical protein